MNVGHGLQLNYEKIEPESFWHGIGQRNRRRKEAEVKKQLPRVAHLLLASIAAHIN